MKKSFIVLVIIVSILAISGIIYLIVENNIPTILSILNLFITAFLWLYFNKKFEEFKKTSDKKFQSYSELINLAKSFTNDPSLTSKDLIVMQKKFIEKYNNEILPFWPKKVVEAVQDFLFHSWTKFVRADQNLHTKSLLNIIQVIRSDLWLEKLNQEIIEFHAINDDNFKNKSSKVV